MNLFNVKTKNLRYGGYATLVSIFVIAIAIVINILFSNLNWHVDLTQQKIYSLSDKTKEIVKKLEVPVSLYVLSEAGNEQAAIKEVLTKYDKLNAQLSVTYKDPVLYPGFVKNYLDATTTSIPNGSIIVENTATKKHKILTPTDFFNYSYTNTGSPSIDSIILEESLTSAISYVTSEIDHTVYVTSGHSEAPLPTSLNTLFSKANYTIQNLNLLTGELGDPLTSTLLIYSPRSDFSEDEIAKITHFLNAGGKAMVFADYDSPELPHFNQLLDYYGITLQKGIVVEADNNYMLPTYPTYLLPQMKEHAITSPLLTNKLPLLVPLASGLEITDTKREAVTVTPLVTSSSNSYLKTNLDSSTLTLEEGDIEGPITIACGVEELNKLQGDTPVTTRLLVIGNSYFVDDSKTSLEGTGNLNFITNGITWLQNDTASSFAIGAKSFDNYALPNLSTTHLIVFGFITVILMPLIVIISGISMWLRRRNL